MSTHFSGVTSPNVDKTVSSTFELNFGGYLLEGPLSTILDKSIYHLFDKLPNVFVSFTHGTLLNQNSTIYIKTNDLIRGGNPYPYIPTHPPIT